MVAPDISGAGQTPSIDSATAVGPPGDDTTNNVRNLWSAPSRTAAWWL